MRKTFEIPLDIPDVTIQTVETDRHGDFVITVKSTVEGTSCHTCGKKVTKVYGYDREITLRHLPILGRKTYIPDIEQPLPGRNLIYLAYFLPKELENLSSQGGNTLNDYFDVPLHGLGHWIDALEELQ